jgi:hypothetical protein
MRGLSLCFAGGCFGGLVNGLLLWFAGQAGLPAMLGVNLAPDLTPQWLYPRIVWGGLWGLLFFLPIPRTTPFFRGAVFSLGPTLVQLLVVFPHLTDQPFGLSLGTLTPLFVVVYNLAWGLATALWLVACDAQPASAGSRPKVLRF